MRQSLVGQSLYLCCDSVPSGPSATTQEETCSSSPSISGNRLAFVNPNETSTKDKLPLDIPNPFDKNTGYPAIPTEKLRR